MLFLRDSRYTKVGCVLPLQCKPESPVMLSQPSFVLWILEVGKYCYGAKFPVDNQQALHLQSEF